MWRGSVWLGLAWLGLAWLGSVTVCLCLSFLHTTPAGLQTDPDTQRLPCTVKTAASCLVGSFVHAQSPQDKARRMSQLHSANCCATHSRQRGVANASGWQRRSGHFEPTAWGKHDVVVNAREGCHHLSAWFTRGPSESLPLFANWLVASSCVLQCGSLGVPWCVCVGG